MRRLFVGCLLLLGTPLAGFQQLAFEVASIKENKSLSEGGTLQMMPGGGLSAVHASALALIRVAYGLQDYQLSGGPEWASNTFYDLNARPAGTATREQTLAMLKTLLADRFKLSLHRETRQVDGFALVRMRPDALGPGMRPSDINCLNAETVAATPRCRTGSLTMTTLAAIGMPVSTVGQLLVSRVHAPINDETALTGTFDVDLRWSDEVAPTGDLPNIYSAIQEQLGLKLERRRVSMEVSVVDHIERATPD